MTNFFYDTNALLHSYNTKQHEPFIMSNLTFKELQEIKENVKKDPDIKYKARKLIKWLMQNEQIYHVIKYDYTWDISLRKYPVLDDNIDSRIIISALYAKNEFPNLKFITHDANCLCLAKDVGLDAQYLVMDEQDYIGYKEIICENDDKLVNFYSSFNDPYSNIYNLLSNQYIIIKDQNGNPLSVHKYKNGMYQEIQQLVFNSKMFGKIKAKDIYQKIAMDSIISNTITLLRGPAGTGKSLISLAYLFERLEKGKIDKIIIFCNTVATEGSARLGFYPGSRQEKLLDSQIGNFLGSKLGDRFAVEALMEKDQLLLLPMSDIRGYDTSGLKAGIYITQAQNMNIDLMKLALQRVGNDSVIILDGDDKCQVDMPIYGGMNSGLKRVSKVFRGQNIYGEVTLKNIYRSKIAEIAQKM